MVALSRSLVIHVAYVLQTTVHTVDIVKLRRNALQLDFIDGVESGNVAVEACHLLNVASRAFRDVFRVVGNRLVTVEQYS